MATKTPNHDNISTALDALAAELGTAVEKVELEQYLARLDSVIAAARAIKKEHAKAAAVIASQKSRAARKARVEKALALLAEQEAAGGTDAP